MAARSPQRVTLDGRGVTSAAVSAIAREGAPVVLAADARARNAAAAEVVADLVARGAPVYGVTTGVGPFRSRAVSAADRSDHQLRLLRSHAAGGGRPLSPSLVRAAMAVRANQFGAGGGGVSDDLLCALIDALAAGVVPFARELGSLGTGDITVLAEIALALLGEGRAWRGAELVPADVALADAGVAPARLGVRDGIAFMSSSAATIGHAALLAVDADRLLRGALTVAALSFLAAGADPLVLDDRVHAARPHPGQVAVAARMRELLGAAPVRRDSGTGPVHDPYPFRALAQVDGAARDAVSGLELVLGVELNAANENALVDPNTGAVLPNANFHAAPLALALDRLRAALAQWSALVAARVSALLDPGLMGLPPGLSPRPGPHSGALALEYTAHAAAADVRSLAAPVATQTATVGGGIESHASFAPLAARRAQEALESAAVVVATELVVAFRALRMRGSIPVEGEVAGLLAAAAERLGPDLGDRALGDDVEAARRLLLEWRAPAAGRTPGPQPLAAP
jgi:histidine ammonia-lyase